MKLSENREEPSGEAMTPREQKIGFFNVIYFDENPVGARWALRCPRCQKILPLNEEQFHGAESVPCKSPCTFNAIVDISTTNEWDA